MTLLEMVQDILSDLDSDTVDSYTDTVESQQVASILKTTYFNIVDSREWPHFFEPITLETTGVATPTKLTIPTSVTLLKYVKYSQHTVADPTEFYKLLKYLEPQRFMNMLDARDPAATGVDPYYNVNDGVKFNILNNKPPEYYTSFDEQSIYCDSYDVGVDPHLRGRYTQVYAMVYPDVTMSDTMYFSLPTNMFNLLLAEAKAVSFRILKQVVNPAAEYFAQSQRARFGLQSWKLRENKKIQDFSTQPIQATQQQQQG